jgi:hypothetical protein
MHNFDSEFDVIRHVAAELLLGRIIHCGDVTCGNGSLTDWRTVKSGNLLLKNADAFDCARLFTKLVGTRYVHELQGTDE